MKVRIIYPLPFDQWPTFEPFVKRFAETLKQFPAGHDFELWLQCCWGEPTDTLREMFRGTKAVFHEYFANGCDIGSAQAIAVGSDPDTLILAMTTRCYFHREGWLKRYVEAREKYGPGLYGATASWEGGRPHICTRAYAMDAGLWKQYPHVIDTREKGQFFETGPGCVSTWVLEQGRPLVQVTWDGEQLFPEWRPDHEKEIYRRGSQAAVLVWDKHTDAYTSATGEMKQFLSYLADAPSYSQNGEDVWMLKNLKLPVKGTFVEVGAHDGVSGSNTLLFEQIGWTGVCVEADPELAELCRTNRGCIVESVAAGEQDGMAQFFINVQDRGLSGLTRPGNPKPVPIRRLDTILKQLDGAEIDLLSIDTEGTELDVWEGLGKIRPRFVVIEHQTCDLPSQEGEIRARLTADGYCMVHATKHNLIFSRERSS